MRSIDISIPKDVYFDNATIKKFNASLDKDWNKFVKLGIPFVRRKTYERLNTAKLQMLNLRTSEKHYETDPLTPEEEKEY